MIRSPFFLQCRRAVDDLAGDARAQYGYPCGYGNYGWGGWGSTPQSSLARGLGYFNMGRGAYNEQTAVARSINTDTVMRWNQYVYQSHLTAINSYTARLLARRTSINRARAETKNNCATTRRIATSPMAMPSTSCSTTSRTRELRQIGGSRLRSGTS